MTTLYASTAAIQARARGLDPVKVFIAVVCALPFALFYVARFAWFVTSLLIAAGMEGWEASGRRIETRRSAAESRRG